jgi:hypothetical protein
MILRSRHGLCIHILLHSPAVHCPQRVSSAHNHKDRKVPLLQNAISLISSNCDTSHSPSHILLRLSKQNRRSPFQHRKHKAYHKMQLKEPSTEPPNPLLAVLSAFTLVLRIPFLLVTAPKISIPTSVRRSTSAVFQDVLGKALIWVSVLAIGLVSVLGDPKVGRIICDLGLVAALASTYLLPGKPHLFVYIFSRHSLFCLQ